MTTPDQDHWQRARERLRAEVGDEVFTSWFARMDLEAVEAETIKLSVATRFLKSWIQSHYAERLMACLQAEFASVSRIEITVRSGVLRTMPPKAKLAEQPATIREPKSIGNEIRTPATPISAAQEAP